MICLLALPIILQHSDETDHRHDALGSIVDSHNLYLTADPTIPGQGDQIEEDQLSGSEPSAESDHLPIGQDSLPDVEIALAEMRRDQAPADHEPTNAQTVSPTPNLPTEEDQSFTEQVPPSPSDANNSDQDDSDLDLTAKATLFLDDCTHKERAQLVDCLGEIHQHGIDQGYAEGCVQGDAPSAAFQGRLDTQHAAYLEDMTAQRDSLSQQLDQRTAESQDPKNRKDALNTQRVEIKRIGELKGRRSGPRTSAKMQRKLGVVNSPPKPPMTTQREPIKAAAKGKGKMPVGNHSGKAEVRSLKTTWRPDQEESRLEADVFYSATPAQPAVSEAQEERTNLDGANTEAPSMGRALDDGSGSEAQCPHPMPTRRSAPVDRSKKSVSPPGSANTPKTAPTLSAGPSKSVPTPAPSSASSSTPTNSGPTAAPGTVHSSPPTAPCRKPIGPINESDFDDLAEGFALIKLEDQNAASVDELAAGFALTKLEDQYAAAIDDLAARLALIKLEDQQAASESEPTDESGDTRMSDASGSSTSDAEDASRHTRRQGARTRGTGLVRWIPLTARRSRRASKKRNTSLSAHAPKSLKLGQKLRSVSHFMAPLARRGDAVGKTTRATKRLMIVDRPDHSSRKWAAEQWARRQERMDLQ
ncbi:MAG: hypothetical protein LQ344_003656 [Seirophora lacunosa]|nr:MAG: hypothetical protein LQ344_003656 [Seirophora lacunosa]